MMRKISNNNNRSEGIDNIDAFRNLLIATISGIIIFLLFLYFVPQKTLVAVDFETGERLQTWSAKNAETFTVHYLHSVERCPVSETYIIDGMEIILSETTFASYGAGLPASTEYSFEISETGFRIYDINTKMENLVYRTGAEGTEPTLSINGEDYRFLDFSRPRGAVEFKVLREPSLTYLARRFLGV